MTAVFTDKIPGAHMQVFTFDQMFSGSDFARWRYHCRVAFLNPWTGEIDKVWPGFWACEELTRAHALHREIVSSLWHQTGPAWEKVAADTVRGDILNLAAFPVERHR